MPVSCTIFVNDVISLSKLVVPLSKAVLIVMSPFKLVTASMSPLKDKAYPKFSLTSLAGLVKVCVSEYRPESSVAFL